MIAVVVLFWVSLGALVWTHAAYPLAAYAIGSLRRPWRCWSFPLDHDATIRISHNSPGRLRNRDDWRADGSNEGRHEERP